jgi:flagellar biosynthesis/type III secretory pathway M-ring protein FliF/YscJ
MQALSKESSMQVQYQSPISSWWANISGDSKTVILSLVILLIAAITIFAMYTLYLLNRNN